MLITVVVEVDCFGFMMVRYVNYCVVVEVDCFGFMMVRYVNYCCC